MLKHQYMNVLEEKLGYGTPILEDELSAKRTSVWRMSAPWNPFAGEPEVEVWDLYHIYLVRDKYGGWVGYSPEDGGSVSYPCLQAAWDNLTAMGAHLVYP